MAMLDGKNGVSDSIIALVQSGLPVDLATGHDQPGNGPDLIAPIHYPREHLRTAVRYEFVCRSYHGPRIQQHTDLPALGHAGRNQVYGPGYRLNSAEFTQEFTQEFTHPNSNMTGGNFGQIEGTQVYSNREIQLAARLTF